MSEKNLLPFNPEDELNAGHYVYDEELDIGKFDRCYCSLQLDADGKPFLLGTYQDDYIDFINKAQLPDGVFVPTISQMEAWNEAHIGEDWRDCPDDVLKAYGVDYYGDIYHADELADVGEVVYLASASSGTYGCRMYLVANKRTAIAEFDWYGRNQCSFVPVFFDGSFLKAVSNI